ncbi:MAG: Zn-ribbon domain-containing OB-fold protein [Acidimicrobiia bacterium]
MTSTSSTDVAQTGGRLIDEALFDVAGDQIALAGSRCVACDAVTFPAQRSCPRCAGDDVVTVPLPRTGTLWGFTVQAFPPKTPYLRADERPFVPYAVGYVDLDHRVLVESRIVTECPTSLAVGDEMTLVLEQLHRDESGPVLTYAFAPVGRQRALGASDAESTQRGAP